METNCGSMKALEIKQKSLTVFFFGVALFLTQTKFMCMYYNFDDI